MLRAAAGVGIPASYRSVGFVPLGEIEAQSLVLLGTMRIVHFLPSLNASVGGPARAVIDLCGALADRGHDVTVATSDSGQAPESWVAGCAGKPRMIILRRPSLPGFVFRSSELAVAKDVLAKADVLHLHGIWELANIQLARIAQSLDKPYVISPRGMLAEWSLRQRSWKKRAYLFLIGQRWLANAAKVHLTADGELDQAAKWFAPHQAVVIPNLLDLEQFEELPNPELAETRLALARGRPRVLFLSRIHPKKGLDVLIHACALLKKRGIPVSLVVAGEGNVQYVNSMRTLASQLGLEDSEASFVGAVTGEDKLALYRACDLMALPTQQENFGFVFIEALACALPVVTTNAIDLHRELQSSGAVTILDRIPETFSDAIASLLQQSDSLKASGIRGREWTFEVFSKAKITSDFEVMYGAAAAEGNPFSSSTLRSLDARRA